MAEETGLPAPWEIRMSNSKNLPYYFNPKTSESRWEPPDNAEMEKLKVYMAKNYTVPSSHKSNGHGGDKIRCAHLLVKHRDSRRPSSWKENKITRSKEEAMAIIRGYQEKIKSKQATLMDLAATESDCGSARKQGDLGYFGKGDMQKEFEDVAFTLQPGEISDVVESASGLHLIERLD